MTPERRQQLIDFLELDDLKREKANKFKLKSYYKDKGPLRRELYPKHLAFFKAGNEFRQRLILAANRVGKTEGIGGYETALHLTGLYPEWWMGRRFDRPVDAWAAGDTSKTVRDIIQLKLLGPLHDRGTGLIPEECIHRYTLKSGVGDAVETIYVKHVSGGISKIDLKSYDQRREAFQGTKKDFIWLDEEPPQDIHTECLLRVMGTNPEDIGGFLMLTFTPLQGLTEVVLDFLPGGEIKDRKSKGKFVIMATWDDVPHLSKEEKEELWDSMPPHQRDARSKGIPQLGSGAIYPVPEEEIKIDPFELPPEWPRWYSMDVGWNRTAVGWYAWDRENDIIYRYGEHYKGQAEPEIHAAAIKKRGAWIHGVIDPAARGRGQRDGKQLIKDYKDLGLKITPAKNAVESGIYQVWQRLSTGRLKVFSTCQNWFTEYRIYRRDDKGKIVKDNDHAMDETRYAIVSGYKVGKTKPIEKDKTEDTRFIYGDAGSSDLGWMGG